MRPLHSNRAVTPHVTHQCHGRVPSCRRVVRRQLETRWFCQILNNNIYNVKLLEYLLVINSVVITMHSNKNTVREW